MEVLALCGPVWIKTGTANVGRVIETQDVKLDGSVRCPLPAARCPLPTVHSHGPVQSTFVVHVPAAVLLAGWVGVASCLVKEKMLMAITMATLLLSITRELLTGDLQWH